MDRDLAKRVRENVRRFAAGEELLAPVSPIAATEPRARLVDQALGDVAAPSPGLDRLPSGCL